MKSLKKFTIRHLKHVESLQTEEIRQLLQVCEGQLKDIVEDYTPSEDDAIVNGHLCSAWNHVLRAIDELKESRRRLRGMPAHRRL